jgi:hypothetical protein
MTSLVNPYHMATSTVISMNSVRSCYEECLQILKQDPRLSDYERDYEFNKPSFISIKGQKVYNTFITLSISDTHIFSKFSPF